MRCGAEMTEGFVLMQGLSVFGVKLVDDENSLNRFGGLRAAICPKCGEVSLYSENAELLEEEKQYRLCPFCGYPVYDDETACANCGKRSKPEAPKRFGDLFHRGKKDRKSKDPKDRT